ncbi:hypothetical protein NQ314_004507 [Rhamnusium bicolor]|uniref:Uncharacterized protein n=1 Tax=Rhamnusium bicolor TaxID=1586634 RepID=A0AAV8ZMG3_9CUCU|nr:hypothetical protein NQ314_004507 [Rhamnusium bicolor]
MYVVVNFSRNRSDLPINSSFSKIQRNESTNDFKLVDQVENCIENIVTQVQELESPTKESGKKFKSRIPQRTCN